MQLTSRQLTHIYFLFALVVLAFAACVNMRMQEGLDMQATLGRYSTALALAVWGTSALKTVIFTDYQVYMPSLPVKAYVVFFMWAVISTVLNGTYPTTVQLLLDVIFLTLPMVLLVVTYNTMCNYGPSRWDVPVFCLMMLMMLFQYMLIFREQNIFLTHTHLLVSYYMLYMLPLVFLSKSKAVRIIFTLFATIAVVSSVKRAGLLALALALLTYLVSWMFVSKRLKVTTVVFGLIGLTAFGFIVYLVGSSDENNNVFERFENIGDDNGSNRVLVWQTTAAMIEKSDIDNYVTGHGYNSVVGDSPIGLSAHNDFLEVTYDYGLIGIVLYVFAIVTTLAYLLKLLWAKSEYAPPLAMLMVLYLSLSMMSHVIIYFFANIVMLTIGYIAGNNERELCSEPTESY